METATRPIDMRCAGTRRQALWMAAAAWMMPAASWSQGVDSDWPTRPLTLVVPFAPGGMADLTARAVARRMSAELGKPVNVDNRPGAGGIVAGTAVAKAEPDGHTLLLLSNASAVSRALFRQLPFDPEKDFAPVSLIGTFDLAIVVDGHAPWRTLRELLNHARDVRGGLTIATISPGSTQHLAAELFKSTTRIDAVTVPYRGTPAVLAALKSGDAQVAFEILGPVLPHLQAGELRALAVTSDRRFVDLPRVPTVEEAGVADYRVASWNALAAPARTPRPVLQRLHGAVAKALADPELQARLRALGVHAQGSTPDQLAALLASETRRWGAVVRAAGIEPQ